MRALPWSSIFSAVVVLVGVTLAGVPEGMAAAGKKTSPAKSEPKPAALPLPGMFAEKTFGYTIRYPEGWTVSQPGGYAVVIGGPTDSPQYASVVSIDNRRSPRPGEPIAGAAALLKQYLDEVSAKASQPVIERQAPFGLGSKGRRLDGFQAVVQFNGDSMRLRQWAVIVPRPSGTIIHVWTFTAPLDEFDRHQFAARSILESWALTADEKPAPESGKRR